MGVARTALICSLLGAAAGVADESALAHLRIGQSAPGFSAPSADGGRHRLTDYAGKVVVLEWTSPVCPFTAVKYDSGAMQSLQSYAASQHAVWLSIDTAAPGRAGYLTAAAARERIRATHARVTAFLFDRDGRIARAYGAKTTPSFFILDQRGRLVYQGAMDEEITDAHPASRNFVHEALASLIAGNTIRTSETPQRGCAVEY